MKNITQILLIIFVIFNLFVSGCKKEENPVVQPKENPTQLKVTIEGFLNYGGVVIGDYRETQVKIYNTTSNVVEFLPSIQGPFSLGRFSDKCLNNKILANSVCSFFVKFSPLQIGNFSAELIFNFPSNLTVNSNKISFLGRGLIGGDVALSEYELDFGSFSAGTESYKTVIVTNTGNFNVPFPRFFSSTNRELIPGLVNENGASLLANFCGTYIDANSSCLIKFMLIKQTTGIQTDLVTMKVSTRGNGESSTILSFNSSVVPGDPSGEITFEGTAPAMTANGSDQWSVTTKPITDQFGNIVPDGTPVRVRTSNLQLLTSTTVNTVGGRISIDVKASTTKGPSSIQLSSGNANGSLSLYLRAGLPFGTLTLQPYDPVLPADGSTSLTVRLNIVYDKFGNIVENGTPISLSLTGGGSLSDLILHTYNGYALFSITAGEVTQNLNILARANPIYGQNNELIDYAAKGDFPIAYIPGPPAGEIPVESQLEGMHAATDISLITIGPVVDKKGNVVTQGTPLTLSITNGINVNGGNSLSTDTNGMTQFTLKGSDNRGPITVKVWTTKALGEKVVWAYKESHLTSQGQKRNDWGITGDENINSSRMYIRYAKATNEAADLPSLTGVWDEIFDYNKLALSDHSYYELQKVNGSPINTRGVPTEGEEGYISYSFPISIPSLESQQKGSMINMEKSPIIPYFESPVFYSAGSKLMSAPFWDGKYSSPIPGSSLFGCSERDGFMNTESFNALMFMSDSGLYSCMLHNGTPLTTNESINRNRFDSKSGLYAPTIGYIEDPIGCSFDGGQAPVYNFDLGSQQLGDQSPKIITLSNPSGADVSIISATLSDTNKWELLSPICSVIEAGGNCDVLIRFKGSDPNVYSTSLKIVSSSISVEVFLSLNVMISSPGVPNVSVGTIPLKGDCYSRLISLGGYRYIKGEKSVTSEKSDLLSIFNANGQLISHFDNNCGSLSTQSECQSGFGCSWVESGTDSPPFMCINSMELGMFPQARGFGSSVSVEKKLYVFGGFNPNGDGDLMFDGVLEFNSETGQWTTLQIEGDPNINNNFEEDMPLPRYQHAMTYVPEKKSIFVYGGLTNDLDDPSVQVSLTDLWSLDLYPKQEFDEDGMALPKTLKWNRVCKNCHPGLPQRNFAVTKPLVTGPGYNPLTPPPTAYMIWNRPHQKMFLYWLGLNDVFTFDPLSDNISESFEPLSQLSRASDLAGSFQVLYNQKLGRLYSYNRGIPSIEDPIYPSVSFWDMDAEEKTYFRARFNLGKGSKRWTQVLTPRVRAFGDSDLNVNHPEVSNQGVISFIYNYDTSQWDLIGENTAKKDSEAWSQPELTVSYNDFDATSHVSEDGFVDIIVLPKGDPSEYHRMFIDYIFVDGTF